MRSGLTLPSLASPQQSGAKASRNYCGSSPIRVTNGCPMLCAHVFMPQLGSQLLSLKKADLGFDRMIMAWHRSNQTSKRLNCIPGVGPLLATALVASVADPKTFRSGRNFSAWIGLVPKQHSSAGVGIGSGGVSANRGIAICAACSWPAHLRRHSLCQDPRHQVSALGRSCCWHDGRPKSPPSRLPTSSPEWPGQ